MPKLADNSKCTGCLACISACTRGALRSCYNEEGHLFYKIDDTLCVECGLCEKACPVESGLQYGSNNLKESQPYAAWCKNEVLRPKSSSGGVFAGLAQYIIEQGGVVIGASLQHNAVKHIVIETVEKIQKLQGSKYTQSNTDGIYKKAKQFLKEGRNVLFSGLGCQVAGLLSYLGNKEYAGKLYTVDLICGGAPSRFIIDYYLKESPNVDEIVAFRNKAEYKFSVKTKDGLTKVIPLSERPFPLCGFYTELTNRYLCYDCQFAYTHRQADMTIGDLWGDKRYMDQHKKGVSLVIVHSSKGDKLLEESEIERHQVEWKDVLPYNPRIAYGKNILVNTRERKRLSIAFKEDSFQKLLDDYANDASFKRPWSVVRKIYRVLLITINHKIAVRKIKKILKG
jgi:coenzyme F420-reducing hydrogenase beta subunit